MSVRAFNRDLWCLTRKTREEKETSDESFFFAHKEHEAANEVFLSMFVYNTKYIPVSLLFHNNNNNNNNNNK